MKIRSEDERIETRDLVIRRSEEEMKREIGERKWWAGEQVKALRFYLRDNAKIVFASMTANYQGDIMGVIEAEGKVILWRDGFGSCSGCDALDGCDVNNGFEYVYATMSEGNTKQFNSYEEAYEWLNNTNDYWWRNNYERKYVLEFLKKKMKEGKQ